MYTGIEKIKRQIINAGEKAVKELIKVAQEDIIKFDTEDDLAADRLKNAATTKKLAIFDGEEPGRGANTNQGFAERRSKK